LLSFFCSHLLFPYIVFCAGSCFQRRHKIIISAWLLGASLSLCSWIFVPRLTPRLRFTNTSPGRFPPLHVLRWRHHPVSRQKSAQATWLQSFPAKKCQRVTWLFRVFPPKFPLGLVVKPSETEFANAAVTSMTNSTGFSRQNSEEVWLMDCYPIYVLSDPNMTAFPRISLRLNTASCPVKGCIWIKKIKEKYLEKETMH
jgi:hypothetical protein